MNLPTALETLKSLDNVIEDSSDDYLDSHRNDLDYLYVALRRVLKVKKKELIPLLQLHSVNPDLKVVYNKKGNSK